MILRHNSDKTFWDENKIIKKKFKRKIISGKSNPYINFNLAIEDKLNRAQAPLIKKKLFSSSNNRSKKSVSCTVPTALTL